MILWMLRGMGNSAIIPDQCLHWLWYNIELHVLIESCYIIIEIILLYINTLRKGLIHTNQVNYYMMNFINFWLEMQVAIKHEENLSFYPVVLNCKYHWCNFQIFVYSNLQNSLAASGGVITFCTARLMVSPYVCREEHGLVPRQFSHVWPCLSGTFYMALALACHWYWWMGRQVCRHTFIKDYI